MKHNYQGSPTIYTRSLNFIQEMKYPLKIFKYDLQSKRRRRKTLKVIKIFLKKLGKKLNIMYF